MRTFTITDSLGNEIEMVEIETSEGNFTQMTKATYDALPVVVPPTFN